MYGIYIYDYIYMWCRSAAYCWHYSQKHSSFVCCKLQVSVSQSRTITGYKMGTFDLWHFDCLDKAFKNEIDDAGAYHIATLLEKCTYLGTASGLGRKRDL